MFIMREIIYCRESSPYQYIVVGLDLTVVKVAAGEK